VADTSQSTWNDWIGADVVDREGDKIGVLETVYMDGATGQPEWLAVKTGLFGRKGTFIPVAGVGADGSALQVPYEAGFVKDAPNVDSGEGGLSGEEEAGLYQYYGREDYREWDDSTDRDVSGSETETDSAMTRSEEELAVGTRTNEAGRVRLRKYVVTENVTTTVPVRKEKVRIERDPITEANAGDATSGADISEDEHEVVLSEEEIVVDKKVVPKERVRMDKETEVEQREVSDEVRKEKIEVEDDTDR